MKTHNLNTLNVAAAKAGMDRKTAHKYVENSGKLLAKTERQYRTRENPFSLHLDEINELLKGAPELTANTIFMWLTEQYPNTYQEQQLRTLQRYIQYWRSQHGKNKTIIFMQNIQPGIQSQSDWTCMNNLNITIAGREFHHLFFHFILPFSHWESVRLSFSESFDSLTLGYEKAVWELGGTLPEHRTDNLTAATQKDGGSRIFTKRWEEFLSHYKVIPSRNNPGESQENGSVEKSHDNFKRAVNQYLLLRGSRDFPDEKTYINFIQDIINKKNAARTERLAQEDKLLRELPANPWGEAKILNVRVSPSSLVNVLSIQYSVPSRLISYSLRAYVYPEKIELYYGGKCLQTMPRQFEGFAIDYRHIIDSLIRKPAAFFNYQYQSALFPNSLFRSVYDDFIKLDCKNGHKKYLSLLLLAKLYGESSIIIAIELLRENKKELNVIELKLLIENKSTKIPEINISKPCLKHYDNLHDFKSDVVAI